MTESIKLSASDESSYIEHVCEDLDKMLDTISPNGTTYRSRGQNVGWQNTTATATVDLRSGRDVLSKFCPDSEWTLRAKLLSEDELELKLWHHDSPTGEIHRLTSDNV